jgi:hypothetical protein
VKPTAKKELLDVRDPDEGGKPPNKPLLRSGERSGAKVKFLYGFTID